MRDIIRRLIRLIRIRWREYRRPVESLESIARRRIAAVDWKHQMDLAAFAFEMAVQPTRQKVICGTAPPQEMATAQHIHAAHVAFTREAYQRGLQNYRPQTPCPTAAQAAFNRADYMLLKNSAMEFVYGRHFKYMIACSIGLKVDKVKDVEIAMSELMAVDGHLKTGNIGSERAYYFKW